MTSKSKPHIIVNSDEDPWKDYRTNNGEFRRWLHTWYYQGDERRYMWVPLPWVCKEPLSGEFLRAMHAIGVTQRWPAEWVRWQPPSPMGTIYNVYGIILDRHTDMILTRYLTSKKRQTIFDVDFQAILRRHILFPATRRDE